MLDLRLLILGLFRKCMERCDFYRFNLKLWKVDDDLIIHEFDDVIINIHVYTYISYLFFFLHRVTIDNAILIT